MGAVAGNVGDDSYLCWLDLRWTKLLIMVQISASFVISTVTAALGCR